MEVKAIGNNLRISPRKMKLVVDLIRGKNAKEALSDLEFVQKKAAKLTWKVLRSAVANATNNHNLNEDKLVISEIFVNKGLNYKRGKAVSRGRFFRITKPGSNLTIKLTEK